jgi:predicted unusual protein kinase regulating ubiquinone biosynthesis (AarF/ABC1/UbiB family)
MGYSRHKYVVSKLLKSAIRARNNPDQNDFFDVFCATLQDLGGVYVKFLQGLMLDRTMKTKNERLLDIFENNVFADVDPVLHLHTQLGYRSNDVRLTDLKPIAAGSYSAVYRAVHVPSGL